MSCISITGELLIGELDTFSTNCLRNQCEKHSIYNCLLLLEYKDVLFVLSGAVDSKLHILIYSNTEISHMTTVSVISI